MTKDEAIDVVFTFGKHEGKSVGEVLAEDSEYLDWLDENFTPRNLLQERLMRAVHVMLDLEHK